MQFFLGTDRTHWLKEVEFPLFISHRSLRRRKSLPQATCDWSLDSGGFTEISQHGAWVTSPEEYIDAVHRYADGIGRLDWVSPQDWMCEPPMVAKTGLSVLEHQERTIDSFLDLRDHLPQVIPVVQGWELDDYHRCVAMYQTVGVDLSKERIVGIGSVCRRQHSDQIAQIFSSLHDAYGLRMHGFGVKTKGLAKYGQYLTSSDSMAWSFAARFDDPLPGCTHPHCNHCLRYAIRWRNRVLERLP